eukprot:TRINITY_DN6546_c0_g2_i5.p2 TRINITY_DN6546_c0_g2~~TRINITY_DN6546_c0_g2_i5.p2  ORF type:complete len:231 (+),score=-22.98 TRINITY_DN6546_c0_g2_i5:26-694(+)
MKQRIFYIILIVNIFFKNQPNIFNNRTLISYYKIRQILCALRLSIARKIYFNYKISALYYNYRYINTAIISPWVFFCSQRKTIPTTSKIIRKSNNQLQEKIKNTKTSTQTNYLIQTNNLLTKIYLKTSQNTQKTNLLPKQHPLLFPIYQLTSHNTCTPPTNLPLIYMLIVINQNCNNTYIKIVNHTSNPSKVPQQGFQLSPHIGAPVFCSTETRALIKYVSC